MYFFKIHGPKKYYKTLILQHLLIGETSFMYSINLYEPIEIVHTYN